MKKKLLILCILTIIFLIPSGCGKDNNELYKKVEFGTYSADLSNAKYIGISNREDKSTASINLFNKKVYAAEDEVDLEAIKDNELVTVDTNNEAMPLEIQDEESNSIELPYTPLYVETRGDFTLTIAVHNLIFDENSDYYGLQYELNYFLPLLLSSDDPISFMFNTGASDFGYHITSYDHEYGSALNLLIINNETGKIFDLSSTLYKEVDEQAGNALRVDNLFINENKLTFSVHYEIPEEFNMFPEIIKLNYNYESDTFDKTIYSPGLSDKEFTPVLTDQYYNTLFISDSKLKIIDINESIIDLPENIDFINSQYFLVNDEIYIMTFIFDEYKIDMGKIDASGTYQKLANYNIDHNIYEEFGLWGTFSDLRTFIDITKENSNNKIYGDMDGYPYYNIESYGYKTFIKDNYFYFLSGNGGFTSRSFTLDLTHGETISDYGIELLTIESGSLRTFFIGNKLFYINEQEIGSVDFFNTTSKEVLMSNINVINAYDNFTKYLDEHIYFEVEDLTDNTIKNVYINVKTGEVSFEEPTTDNEVTFRTEIK